jgi:hypothetical protein
VGEDTVAVEPPVVGHTLTTHRELEGDGHTETVKSLIDSLDLFSSKHQGEAKKAMEWEYLRGLIHQDNNADSKNGVKYFTKWF